MRTEPCYHVFQVIYSALKVFVNRPLVLFTPLRATVARQPERYRSPSSFVFENHRSVNPLGVSSASGVRAQKLRNLAYDETMSTLSDVTRELNQFLRFCRTDPLNFVQKLLYRILFSRRSQSWRPTSAGSVLPLTSPVFEVLIEGQRCSEVDRFDIWVMSSSALDIRLSLLHRPVACHHAWAWWLIVQSVHFLVILQLQSCHASDYWPIIVSIFDICSGAYNGSTCEEEHVANILPGKFNSKKF